MKEKRDDIRRFVLYLAAAVAVGCLFLYWGQANAASTLYELGFLRYKAAEQLSSMSEWNLTWEESAAKEIARKSAVAWAEENPPVEGTYETSTAAGIFGDWAGLTLDYRHWRQAGGKTVVLLHGFEETPEDVLPAAQAWYARGWSVLIPDQRGYQTPAESNGMPVTWGVYEQYDLYDLIRAAGLTEEQLVVQGKGIGAAAALLLAADETRADAGLDGIVAESVYDDLGSFERDTLKKLFRLGDNFVGKLLRLRVRDNLGFVLDSVDLTDAAARVKIPVVFLCGSQEVLPGEARTRAVMDACGGETKLIVAAEASYRALWLAEGENVLAALENTAGTRNK